MALAYGYGNTMLKALSKEIDWKNDTVKLALMKNTYAPSIDEDIYFSDVKEHEITGLGYTEGGAEVTNKTLEYKPETDTVVLGANNVSWANSTISANYAVLYDATGTDTTSALIGYIDFGEIKTSSNGTFQITWDEQGIMHVTANPT